MAIFSITRPITWDPAALTGLRTGDTSEERRKWQRGQIDLPPVSMNLNGRPVADCGAPVVQFKGPSIGVHINSHWSEFRKGPRVNNRGLIEGGTPAMYLNYSLDPGSRPKIHGADGSKSLMLQCLVAVPTAIRYGKYLNDINRLPAATVGLNAYFNTVLTNGQPVSFAYLFTIFETRPSGVRLNTVMHDNTVNFISTNADITFEEGGYLEKDPFSSGTTINTWNFPTPGVPSNGPGCFFRFYITPRVSDRIIAELNRQRGLKGEVLISTDIKHLVISSFGGFCETYVSTINDPNAADSDLNAHMVMGCTFSSPLAMVVNGVGDLTNNQIAIPEPNVTNTDLHVREHGIYAGGSWLDPSPTPLNVGWHPNPIVPNRTWFATLQYNNSYKFHQDYIKPFM